MGGRRMHTRPPAWNRQGPRGSSPRANRRRQKIARPHHLTRPVVYTVFGKGTGPLMFAPSSTDPFAALTNVVEVSLPAILSDAAQPRALAGPRGAPDVPYVDTEWPRDEARLLPRYQFLVSLANAIHPSATINASSVSHAINLVDPVTRAPVISRAAADSARNAVDRFDMRGARTALTEGVLEYARGVEADARAALDRLNQRFNEADPARRALPTPPSRVAQVPLVTLPQQPPRVVTQQPVAPRRLPVGIQQAVAPLLGRRPPAERPTPIVGVGPPPRPAWRTALSRLLPGPSARSRIGQQRPPEQPEAQEEEEEEEPLIKRRRRAPSPGSRLTPLPAERDDDLLLAALLEEEGEQPAPSIRSPPSGARGWNLAAAMAAAARQPPTSTQTIEYLPTVSPRAPTTPQSVQGERRWEQEPWTIDTLIQVVVPAVFQRAVDAETVRQEAQRARALADSIRDGYAARIAVGDAEAAANRALHLNDLAGYVEASAAGARRRRPEPFDAAYWYRVVAAGETGPLGPASRLAEARGVIGPYATPEDAAADASLLGFNADEAVMDAVLAWVLTMDMPRLTQPATTVFQVQRPRDERDPNPPRQLAARIDPGVERWVTAVVAARPHDAFAQTGALAVLAWDRAVDGRARRVGVRDVFCPDRDRPCAVVAAYETATPDDARALEQALVAREPPPNVPAAVGEIVDVARVLYPGAAVSVAPNREGSAVVVTVRLPVPLADADQDRLLDLVRMAYGVVAATGAPIDTEASRIVGIDASEAPIPPPAAIVAAPTS
ncbi:hypothetical protein TW95_gp1245 [Pandoravirus inopinatum]|uniref:Uncharacterized protein n=1 Tax=Pandoravirus inopinatum TaxID=1605721 RepID=A0A0B5J311_9VIRU|nr:hypothetical protein TW95_gp1245 [Pandoravirus inopinatum]AJF97979.1 hypothetical protein [Pandoravirus inopinatum]